jgi:hypothetical protein
MLLLLLVDYNNNFIGFTLDDFLAAAVVFLVGPCFTLVPCLFVFCDNSTK